MKLIFASQNKHKQTEVESILGRQFEIVSLSNLNFYKELPETHLTLEENAEEKAEYVFGYFNRHCFAEDTGLEIPALNNEPGVLSARYAGPQKSNTDNIKLVLEKLKGVNNRSAIFRTIICLVFRDEKYFFEGKVNGLISHEPMGRQGFGYDPVFLPEGFNKSYAQLTEMEKNKISHRYIALEKMKTFLLSQ